MQIDIKQHRMMFNLVLDQGYGVEVYQTGGIEVKSDFKRYF